MRRPASALLADRGGNPTVEFAIVLPVMLTLMMGLADLCYQEYVQAALSGAVQKAGRDSTIQGNDAQSDAIDQKVQTLVGTLSRGATFASSRTNYDTYGSTAGEPFTDTRYPNNSSGVLDGICNHGETYTDVNGNGRYDLDLGAAGQGGASDITRYTMTVTYTRLFPVARLIGLNQVVTLSATTLLKNQPYATQTTNKGTGTGTCA